MIPVLYDPSESTFLSNGLGSLSDAISCVVTEERNGQYTLEMIYPVSGIHFSDIRHSALLKVVPSDGATEQLFRIVKITKPMNGRVIVCAEHISYQLSHIPAYPFTATTCAGALQGLKTHAAETCPFTFWTNKSVTQNYTQLLPESIRARLGGQQGSILDIYGGEYEWDNYTVKLHSNRGANRGVTLRYGKNITDLRQEENIENTITGVLPYWADAEGGNVVYASPVYSSNAGNYPYKRTKTVDFSSSFENPPTAAQLTAKAESYILANNIGIPKVSIKVSFVALWQTEEYKDVANLERVKLCDTVTIQFEKLGVNATAKVIKTVYDVLKERYTEIEIGEARTTLSERIVEQDQALQEVPDTDMMQRAISAATALITGAKGGYVVFRYDANQKPIEMLIMDTADVNTATKVWRWNLNGLGYSSSGINGPYTTAITQNGAIVADFITTGTLNASLVTVSNINASNINTGTLNGSQVNVTNINASNINTGTLNGSQVNVTNINASNINTGTLDASQVTVSNINASNIKTGTFTAQNLTTGYNTIIDTVQGIITWTMKYSRMGSDGSINFTDENGQTKMIMKNNVIEFYSPMTQGSLAGRVLTTFNSSTQRAGIGLMAMTDADANIGCYNGSDYTVAFQASKPDLDQGYPPYIRNGLTMKVTYWVGNQTIGYLYFRNGILYKFESA